MKCSTLAILLLAAIAGSSPWTAAAAKDEPSRPEARKERILQGWKVSVDDRLLSGEYVELGRLALLYLESDLATLAGLLNAERLEKLRAVQIVLDFDHGKLRSMQYHPSADWLRDNGYAPELAKCVHIPVASGYTSPRHRHEQPWSVLHELAHAFHDQVLDFENPEIGAAWERYKTALGEEKVLHINGKRTRHYALTNAKEFFAEMSEAYFGMNDFHPFNFAELKEAYPDLCALLETIWGKLPR